MTHMQFIDIAPGVSVLPSHVAAVKDNGDGRTVIFIKGGNAQDGLEVDRYWRDVIDELNTALKQQQEDEETGYNENDSGDRDHSVSANYTHTAINSHGHRIGTLNHGKTWHDVNTGEQIA